LSIFCCGYYHQAQEKRNLQDNEKFENRFIEIITCPNCLKKKALLSQRRIKDGKLIEKTSKKGQADKYIQKWSKEPWEDGLKTPKNGTYNNMNWFYAIGLLNKKPDNKIRDFNNIERDIFNSATKIYNLHAIEKVI